MARLVWLIVLAAVATVFPASARVFDPTTFTLANGMQVVVIGSQRAPVVSHMVWYKVGAADEDPGASGIAHLLEHLMFKGTPTMPEGEFSRLVARHGGQENAFTSYDYTAYFQNIARDRLPMVMRLEADRMRNLVLTDQQVAPEKQVVLEERRQRTDNDPSAQLAEQANATLYFNHPYRRPVIGWAHEVAALTTDQVLDFYRRWYAPNNAILVVAGDVTPEQVRALAEETYGKIPAVDPPTGRLQLAEPPQTAERRVILEDARIQQPAWSRTLLAPSYRVGETAQAYPLQVLATILGDGATSRFYRELVVEQKIAVSAGAGYEPSRRGPGEFMVYAIPTPGVGIDKLEAAADAILAKVARDGVGAEEVERAKRRMVAAAVYARDSLSGGAHVLGQALAIGQGVADVEGWPDRINAVNKQQVDEAAKAVLTQPGSVVAELRPATSLQRAEADPAGAPPVPAPSSRAVR